MFGGSQTYDHFVGLALKGLILALINYTLNEERKISETSRHNYLIKARPIMLMED